MDTFESDALVARPAKRGWRRHSEQFKARVIELACQREASVAAVALANGLNANMLRRWVREHEQSSASKTCRVEPAASFVQLPVNLASQTVAPVAACERVQVQIERGDMRIIASLPLDTGSAVWLREVLR
jgi:transposase-like protein